MSPKPLLLTPPTPPGVSLAGLVAASARLNVLGDVKSTLRSIGLSPARPGCISVRVTGREEALAARLGCEVSVVLAAATPPIDPEDGSIIRWGSGSIRRDCLVTVVRRVSPTSLETSPHHRAAWSNRMLDYCPETLDLLVDRCLRCGRRQRWLAAEGIGFCDARGCGPLPGSGSTLASDLAEGYGLFAAICSAIPAERGAAMVRLAPALSNLPPFMLTDFAMKIGLALEAARTSSRSAFNDLSPVERARAASRGALALGEWPTRLRSEVGVELASRGLDDGVARRELHTGLRAAGGSSRDGSPLRQLMLDALPEINLEIGRAFAGMDGGRVLGSVAARSLGISHARLRHLAQMDLIQEEAVFEGVYRRALYHADRIDAAARAWRGSQPIAALMRELGLPRYACERIVGAGDVEGEPHPFVLTLPGQPRVRAEAIQDYVVRIRSACRNGAPPAGAVRLVAAMKMVGGRLKPWRQVLLAICQRNLPAWHLEGRAPVIARILVDPSDLCDFARSDADEGIPSDAVISTEQSQIDAMTVLNLRQVDGPRLAAAGLLSFGNGTKSLLVRIDEVLAVGRTHVATAEAAARLLETPNAAWHRVVRELGPPSSPAGWSRNSFDQWIAEWLPTVPSM